VFIDEIDSTLSLDFTDDFFIALRYCFTARAENPGLSQAVVCVDWGGDAQRADPRPKADAV
jgi:hypothetical protein